MLSENVEKILLTENQCRENLKRAAEEAAQAEINADTLGKKIVAEMLDKANAEAEKMLTQAENRAREIFSAEREKCSAETEKLKEQSRKNERKAVQRIKEIIF